MSVRCFVKASVGDKYDFFPLQVDSAFLKVANLKSKILERLTLAAADPPSRYDLAFQNGALLKDDEDCRNIRSDDILIFCPNGKSESFLCTSRENTGCTFFDICQLNSSKDKNTVQLDGENLTCENLVLIGMGDARVEISQSAISKIEKSRDVIEEAVKGKKPVYGVTTGFGCFKNKVVSKDQLSELQVNLITSHATGVGKPLSLMRTRMLLALRINVIVKGYSGVRMEIIKAMIAALNADCLPFIPEQGSVGASGDLAPLSHLALGLMGQGQMWSPKTGWGPAETVLEVNGLKKIELGAKEGLALNNGTQMIAALGAEALYRCEMIAKQAEIIAALTIEVLKGVPDQFAEDVHDSRPHWGQRLTAKRLRALLYDKNEKKSTLIESRGNKEEHIQDPYSMRCIPQVHGVVHETIAFVRNIISTELNSATDNPLVMINRSGMASAGNFHGEYPGKALDYLSIGVHELASISERRIERLVHPDYIREHDLPGFLVGGQEGLNNGFMISHYTAAALVSENKVLTHPSTVDSITTSGGSEDHVSMGTYAARKALNVVENVENVLAIELLAACQALDLHRQKPRGEHLSPNSTLEKVYNLVRSKENVPVLGKDRFMTPDIVAVVRLLQEGKIWEVVKSEVPSYPNGIAVSMQFN